MQISYHPMSLHLIRVMFRGYVIQNQQSDLMQLVCEFLCIACSCYLTLLYYPDLISTRYDTYVKANQRQ